MFGFISLSILNILLILCHFSKTLQKLLACSELCLHLLNFISVYSSRLKLFNKKLGFFSFWEAQLSMEHLIWTTHESKCPAYFCERFDWDNLHLVQNKVQLPSATLVAPGHKISQSEPRNCIQMLSTFNGHYWGLWKSFLLVSSDLIESVMESLWY